MFVRDLRHQIGSVKEPEEITSVPSGIRPLTRRAQTLRLQMAESQWHLGVLSTPKAPA